MLHQLLSGEQVDHHGAHYVVGGVALAPAPVRPIDLDRRAIAVRAPPRRALARLARTAPTSERDSPDEVAAIVETLRANGARDDFDVCFIGYSHDAGLPAYAAAGVTSSIESSATTRPMCSSASAAGRRARPCPKLERMDLALLERTLADHGQPAYRAGQAWEWAAGGAAGYDAMTNLPRALRDELKAAVRSRR